MRKTKNLLHSGTCIKCGYIASQELCKACILLEGLNRGLPKLGIGKTHKAKLDKVLQHRGENTEEISDRTFQETTDSNSSKEGSLDF